MKLNEVSKHYRQSITIQKGAHTTHDPTFATSLPPPPGYEATGWASEAEEPVERREGGSEGTVQGHLECSDWPGHVTPPGKGR